MHLLPKRRPILVGLVLTCSAPVLPGAVLLGCALFCAAPLLRQSQVTGIPGVRSSLSPGAICKLARSLADAHRLGSDLSQLRSTTFLCHRTDLTLVELSPFTAGTGTMGLLSNLGLDTGNETQQIQKLAHELDQANQHAHHLALQNRAAQHRIRELQDLLAIQQRLTSDTQATLHLTESRLESLTHSYNSTQTELSTLRTELSKTPTTSLDLFFRYRQLQDLWDQARDTLSCPVCFDFIGKGQVVSLLCGHTFCQGCWTEWENKHLVEFKTSTQQGRYFGPDCPECRESGVRHGKVRVWALEEVIRFVERGTRETEKIHTQEEIRRILGDHTDSSPLPQQQDPTFTRHPPAPTSPIETSEGTHRDSTPASGQDTSPDQLEPQSVTIDAEDEESSWTLFSDESTSTPPWEGSLKK
ncbi:BZ3500_MvSof-1268-A1-R1_Chr8-1g09939 [Microbotryum saponariae]|uniref:BZ3500_MvSof-1268-A1-R1_Chr8-1g09939 protein n=1 Tax=Microbotryum saponariae TaxID=289078 RepID=A0A2X0MFZ6_9BASI|nr:BZ3500_MvSof-1268-A1-R1_Chr8-1g09939 [Microbotryum saponariae]SDA08225.1 BZ3501_MvSof-1269-A2-R1_Chr8-1g09662 [Microbotryum saponariae]